MLSDNSSLRVPQNGRARPSPSSIAETSQNPRSSRVAPQCPFSPTGECYNATWISSAPKSFQGLAASQYESSQAAESSHQKASRLSRAMHHPIPHPASNPAPVSAETPPVREHAP